MGSHDTRSLRSQARLWAPSPARKPERAQTVRADDLAIGDRAGHQRYLGRPLFFGPLDPYRVDVFLRLRDDLEAAERLGREALDQVLANNDLRSVEQWWHIEASFYQRHELGDSIRRSPGGTPAPQLTRSHDGPRISMSTTPPPVSFEVFCEIAGAQAAWSQRGRDPSAEASDHFLLEPEELRAVEVFWAAELAKNRDLARRFARRMLEYKELFSDD